MQLTKPVHIPKPSYWNNMILAKRQGCRTKCKAQKYFGNLGLPLNLAEQIWIA